jgi:hypothetical protein
MTFLKFVKRCHELALLPAKKRNFISHVIFCISRVGTFIVHFKELFALDGKNTNLTGNDISRRNTIAKLLLDWGLLNIISELGEVAPLSQIKVLSYSDKKDWILETKYNIGKKKEV